ncbi:MAG: alanine--tRNA ligase [Pseudomonadota bacterium]
MKSAELRRRFLDYFARNDHQVVASSSLIPANDPTLLFTNAGMVQFKDVFLGEDKRSYRRATTSQRCVRAGGKHNDLENVGYTARHHTFFEMLGNFSFGDYFKREAIEFAWAMVTEEFGLPADRLWVTVYHDDDEAADIWTKHIGVPADRLSRLGEKDNFWSMGDTGPCGPCSEIFYDHGAKIPGGPPGSKDDDLDRYIEIWNLVFMQFDRDATGTMTPLPKPSVDTGMGLERMAAVLQGVHNNYEIDMFRALVEAAANATNTQDLQASSLRVIADHIRACSFLITDGVLPSNEGRGYVLRRIIRRACRHGYKLGRQEPFFNTLVAPLDVQMGEAFPELREASGHVQKVLRQEEERFAETLSHGMKIFEEGISGVSGKVVPGELAFRLYDTYGFPPDLTADIARERGLTVDTKGFDAAMQAQREQAKKASRFGAGASTRAIDEQTRFTGYEHLAGTAKVTRLLQGEDEVDALAAGVEGVVVLEETPFYAESGGQVGDKGQLVAEDGSVLFTVSDTRKFGKAHGHLGTVSDGVTLRVGDTLQATVDGKLREATVRNHSATHLLHAALRQVLGSHVQQKGSLVAPDRLRFDFSHYEAVSAEQLREIEVLVNEQIRLNVGAQISEMPYDDAIAAGALAFFDDKYDENVRVLRLGDFSTELCGGTHVDRAGDIGAFKILSESGIASGVRRVEAATGAGAVKWMQDADATLAQTADLLRTGREDVGEKVGQLLERNRSLEKELERLKAKLAGSAGDALTEQAQDVEGLKVLAARLEGADVKTLRDTVDQLKNKLGDAAVVLASVDGDKVRLIAGVSKSQTKRLKAGDLVNQVAAQVGGKGGGRPDMAQAGGDQPEKLNDALASVSDWVRAQLTSAGG